MKKVYQLTREGKMALEAELAELKSKRGAIAEKIAEARDYGDLSENAEYDSAREEQGLVETRIAEIEDILMNAEEIKALQLDRVRIALPHLQRAIELHAQVGVKKDVERLERRLKELQPQDSGNLAPN